MACGGMVVLAAVRVVVAMRWPSANISWETLAMSLDSNITVGRGWLVWLGFRGEGRDIGGGGEGYEEGKRRDVRPGWRENARTPLLPSFSARAVAKRMLAVLDCEYAVQGLYSAPS